MPWTTLRGEVGLGKKSYLTKGMGAMLLTHPTWEGHHAGWQRHWEEKLACNENRYWLWFNWVSYKLLSRVLFAHTVISILQMAWDAHWECCSEEGEVWGSLLSGLGQGQASGSEHRGREVGDGPGWRSRRFRETPAAEQSPHHVCNWESRDRETGTQPSWASSLTTPDSSFLTWCPLKCLLCRVLKSFLVQCV